MVMSLKTHDHARARHEMRKPALRSQYLLIVMVLICGCSSDATENDGHSVQALCTLGLVQTNPPAPGPVAPGAQVVIDAGASCDVGQQPEFRVRYRLKGNKTWHPLGPWGGPSVNWNTAAFATGLYELRVETRADSTSPGVENAAQLDYGVGPFCTDATLQALTATPQPIGDIANYHATATCPASTTPEFQYLVRRPGESAYTVEQNWSSNADFAWDTTGEPAGVHRVQVRVRAVGNASLYEVKRASDRELVSCSGTCPTPVSDDCQVGTPDVCGNGLDDNCNGEVDEGCSCQPGAVQACFAGPPGRHNIGGCVDGAQTCIDNGGFGQWGPCAGGLGPSAEACDSVDNDCNGCVDDQAGCCTVALSCPSSVPDGKPFHDYVIDGTTFYSGAVSSWQWTVTGGPCDQLHQATGSPVTYTLTGENTSTLTMRPTLSGDYTVHLVITAQDSTVYDCTFIVHVRGQGLRVELCSDRALSTDIDLHLHRPNTTTGWFSAGGGDTCYWSNCKAGSAMPPLWGYANSPLSECGPDWSLTGCRNPRLEVDSVLDGKPENINVDNPNDGESFRVMVNYYAGTGAVHPLVNVYCGGSLRASYGLATAVTGFDTSGGDLSGDMWRVVDVAPQVTAGVTTGCVLAPLHPPGTTTGYWVATAPRTY